MAQEDILDGFIGRKKAESQWLTLDDGESAVIVKLTAVKPLMKTGFDGKEKEILRFVCEVQTSEGVKEKYFDAGTQRFATEVQTKGVKVGSGFTLTRNGLQTKTRYTISNVTGGTNPAAAPATPTPQQALAKEINDSVPPATPTK